MPEGLEGTSFVPLLDEPSREWKQAAFSEVLRRSAGGAAIRGRSLRTERWRYTEWAAEGSEDVAAELYDHDVDPHEWHNLAREPSDFEIWTELRRMLHEGWRSSPDS